MTDPIQSLWASEGMDANPPSPESLAARARAIGRRAWLRDGIEYAALAFVTVLFGSDMIGDGHPVLRIGSALVVLGAILVGFGLWRRRVRPPVDPAEPAAAYLREQMVRQRDMLASVPRWYLAPMVPGLLTFVAGLSLDRLKDSPLSAVLPPTLLALAIVAAIFAVVWWLNHRAARRYNTEIAALDSAHADR